MLNNHHCTFWAILEFFDFLEPDFHGLIFDKIDTKSLELVIQTSNTGFGTLSQCVRTSIWGPKTGLRLVISLALSSPARMIALGRSVLRRLPSQLSFSPSKVGKSTYQPVHPNDLHRAGGIASFMRLPSLQPPKTKGELDVAFLGIPLDVATSNRPGAR